MRQRRFTRITLTDQNTYEAGSPTAATVLNELAICSKSNECLIDIYNCRYMLFNKLIKHCLAWIYN